MRRLFSFFAVLALAASSTAGQRQHPAPDTPLALDRARELAARGRLEEALAIYEQLSETAGSGGGVQILLGTTLLRLGRIEDALAAFESVVATEPSALPHLWQRGIALFYDGRHRECAEQFAAHRFVNPNDVENAAWHFLCVAADEGTAAARRALLPVGRDERVPMAEIYRLYSGRGSAAQVLKRAATGPEAGRPERLFYAHLYIGLFAEASGKRRQALQHYREAIAKEIPFVMGDVARLALARLESRGRSR